MRRWPLLLIACAACGKSGKSQGEGQPYKDAVSIVCHADDAPGFAEAEPAQRASVMSAYVADQVTNAEVLAMIDAIGPATALGRRNLLHEAIIKAGLDTCPALELIAPWPVPDVGAARLETLDARGVVVITEDGVLIADTMVVPLVAFAVDDAEVDEGVITKLAAQIEPVASIHPGSLTLIVDPRTPYRLLYQVIYSVKAVYHRFALTATSDTMRGVVPIVLPDAGAAPPSPELALELEQMVIGLSGDAATVFSLSGREGTLTQPLLRAPLTDLPATQTQLQDALATVVRRRWEGRTRPSASRRIVVIASDDVIASVLVPVLASVRAKGEDELYPDLALSAGLEGETVAKIEETRDVQYDIEATPNVETSLTGAEVAAKIRSTYLAGIRRCATGELEIAFTVSRNGKVVDPRASEAADCLVPAMKGWRFPIAVDPDGDSREAEFTVRLQLRSE